MLRKYYCKLIESLEVSLNIHMRGRAGGKIFLTDGYSLNVDITKNNFFPKGE